MKRHRTVLVASVFLVISLLAANVSQAQQSSAPSSKIVGVWESKSAQGVSMLLLNADGSGEFNGKELRWTFSQNVLSLKFQGGTTYMYETALAANNLVVNSADLKQPIKFTRSGSAASEPAPSRGGGGLGAISAGGRSANSGGPEGTWEVQKENGSFTLVLGPGGSGTFNSDPVKWKFAQGILTLQWENGDVFMYNAALTASSLKVSGGNLSAPIEFQRAGRGASAGMTAGGANPRSGAGGGPVGTWETDTPNGVIQLVLNPDGTGIFGTGSVRWSYNQGAVTMIGPNGKPIRYPATIGPDSLTLTDATSGAALSFRRVGGGIGDAGDEGMEDGEEVAGFPGQGLGEDPAGGFAGGAGGGFGGGGGSSLVGSWQNPQGMTLQLNADGTAVLNGQQYRYTSNGSTITLIASDGQMPFPYSLSGNTLTVSVQGQPVVYTRAGAGGGSARMAGGSFGGGGGGNNPPEMAGKWCAYSGSSTGQIISGREQCFTLHPNGSYEYYGASDSTNQFGGTASQSSDSGTWSVQGSTIVANSRSQGRIVYQLEKKNNKNNDPMLCLDGQCFVTYGQKPPWPY